MKSNCNYDLEVLEIIKEIKNLKAKSVLIQFPDGLKAYAGEVVDEINQEFKNRKTKVQVFIWFGSCYGACDIPISMQKKVDLIIQIGHNQFIKNSKGWKS